MLQKVGVWSTVCARMLIDAMLHLSRTLRYVSGGELFDYILQHGKVILASCTAVLFPG